MSKKVIIKKVVDKDGKLLRHEFDMQDSQTIQKVQGLRGEQGEDGQAGQDGLKGENGSDGKQGVPGHSGKDGKSINPKEAKKITKGLTEDISTLDNNITNHIDSPVHFSDKAEKDKVLDHLEKPHTTTIIQGGSGTSVHNSIRELDGGNVSPKEFFHLNEEDYNTATNILQTPDSLTNVGNIDFNTEKPIPDHKEGRLFYNNQEKTLSFFNDEPDVTLNIGEENWIRVRNETGSTILDGSIVRIMGSSTGLPLIELARADSPVTAESIIGLATHDIEDVGSNSGLVTTFGQVHNLDTSICNAGDILYLSPFVAGEWTPVRPVYPNFIIEIGQCTYVDSEMGVIHVNVIGQITDIAINTFNGSILQSINFTITSDGTTITGNLDLDVSDPSAAEENLTLMFSDGMMQFPIDGSSHITLSPGSDGSPNTNLIYIPIDTKELTVTTGDWPQGEHIKICTAILRSAATTQTDAALGNRNWNDHIASEDGNGHSLHVAERLRLEHAKWISGTALSVSGSGTGNIQFDVTSGMVAQLHTQTFPAILMTTGDDIHIVNDSISPYNTTTDLVTDVTLDATGASIGNNKYFNVVVWGIQNRTDERSHLMLNLPTGSYNGENNAVADINRFDVFTIPSTPNFVGIGFMISRLTFKMGPGGADWTLVNELDLRGTIPGNAAGSSSVLLINSFVDSAFNIFNVVDDTKILEFDLSSITTHFTRTITAPDFNLDLNNPDFGSGTISTTGSAALGAVNVTGNINIQGLLSVGSGDDALAGFNLARFDETMTSGTSFGLTVDIDGDPATVNSLTSLLARTGVNGTGSINDATGFAVFSPEITSGTIVNLYGIQIQDQTEGTSGNWAIKTNAGIVDFGDDVYIASNKRIYFGDNQESSIFFDGTDLNITRNDPSQAGQVRITDDLMVEGDLQVGTSSVFIDGGNSTVKMDALILPMPDKDKVITIAADSGSSDIDFAINFKSFIPVVNFQFNQGGSSTIALNQSLATQSSPSFNTITTTGQSNVSFSGLDLTGSGSDGSDIFSVDGNDGLDATGSPAGDGQGITIICGDGGSGFSHQSGDGGSITITLGEEPGDFGSGAGVDGQFIITNLPSSDPGIVGALYHTSGTVKISL